MEQAWEKYHHPSLPEEDFKEEFEKGDEDDDQKESEEIVQYLPPRFKDIVVNSIVIKCFNLMDDNLIAIRIIYALTVVYALSF